MLAHLQVISQEISKQGKEKIQIQNEAALVPPLSKVHDPVDPGQFQVHEIGNINKIGTDTADQDLDLRKIETAGINMTETDDVDAATLQIILQGKDAVDQFFC